jgi:hypothetical protein
VVSVEKPKDEQSGYKDTTPPPPEFARFEGLLKEILALSKEELDESGRLITSGRKRGAERSG